MECTQNRSENMSGKATTEKSKTEKVESLPEGWKRVRLGEVIEDIGDGGTPPRDDHRNFGGSINWVVIDDIQKRIYRIAETLTEEGLKHSNAKVWKKGAVILSFGATIGEVGIAEVELATKQGIAGIIPKDQVLINIFLYYILKYKKNTLLGLANQTTLKEVRPNVIKEKVDFLLPPLPEQRKIAEILETVDNAIEKTDAIIEKYRRIKKGLMADLLTGKIRLIPYGHSEAEGEESPLLTSPEAKKFVIGNKTFVAVPNQRWKDTPIGKISEDWKRVRLGEVIEEVKDRKGRRNVSTVLTVSNVEGLVDQTDFFGRNLSSENTSKYKIVEKWYFVYNPARINVGSIGLNNSYDLAIVSPMYSVFRTKDKLLPKYLYFWTQLPIFRNMVINNTAGSVRESLNFSRLINFDFLLPPLSEQQLIADVLSQIDEVIEKEIQYKEKLERIKKGLMEDLLTGKVRVNNLIKED
jgi:type I restriction enzyme S subunit